MDRVTTAVRATAVLAGLLLAVPAGPAQAINPSEPASPTDHVPAVRVPDWADRLPARTSQVVRTVSSNRWCRQQWCSTTQAWRRQADGRWELLRRFRSTIGAEGFGKQREGDMRSPVGVYRIKTTFSTGREAPGEMRWRPRLPTSAVPGGSAGPTYNTWVELPGVSDGDRPAMRYGFVVDYNNVRLHRGVGPRPVPGKGSGIFYHTSSYGQRWIATAGCTQLGRVADMRWVVRWLRPDAYPRVVQGG